MPVHASITGLRSDPAGERAHRRQQNEIGQTDAQRHDQIVDRRQMQHRAAEGGRIGGDRVEGDRRHG
jgi:hypothetical protein